MFAYIPFTNQIVCAEDSVEALLNEIQYSTSPVHAARLYQELWSSLETDQLVTLISCKDSSIAIAAAYRHSNRTHDEKRSGRVDSEMQSLSDERVLGVIEGRIHSLVPEFWKAAFVSAEQEEFIEYKEVVTSALRRFIAASSDDIHVAGEDDAVHISRSTRSGRVPAELFRKMTERDLSRCSVQVSGDLAYLFFHKDLPSQGELVAVDIDSQAIQWSIPVWGMGGTPSGGTGVWIHEASVTVSATRILVFGSATWGVYVEAFDRVTGKNLVRFSSSLWNNGQYEMFGKSQASQ